MSKESGGMRMTIDIMAGGRYYDTLPFGYKDLYMIDYDSVYAFVTSRLPSVKFRRDIEFFVDFGERVLHLQKRRPYTQIGAENDMRRKGLLKNF